MSGKSTQSQQPADLDPALRGARGRRTAAAGTGFRRGELSFFWTPWGNLCDAGVRSNSYDPFQDTWREGDEYDVSRYKGKGPFFSEAGPSTLAAVQNGLQGQMPPLCPPPSGEFQGIFSGAPGSAVSPSF